MRQDQGKLMRGDERSEAEQEIAERIEILSRALRGALYADPDLIPPVIDVVDTIITSLLTIMRDRYEAAGSPYGSGDDGLWRWWNELRQPHDAGDTGEGR